MNPHRIPRDRPCFRIDDRLEANLFVFGGSPHSFHRGLGDGNDVYPCHVEPQLSHDDLGDVQQILDQLTLNSSISFDGL